MLYEADIEKNLKSRIERLKKLAELLESRRHDLARLITDEMGKILAESETEVDKAIAMVDYYIKHGQDFATEEKVESSQYKEAVISHQPLGPTLSKACEIHEFV